MILLWGRLLPSLTLILYQIFDALSSRIDKFLTFFRILVLIIDGVFAKNYSPWIVSMQ